MMLPYHYEGHASVAAAPEGLFAHLDDQVRLSSHMARSSRRMGGGRMQIDVDGGRGQKVGSRIRMTGRVQGIAPSVDEVVTEREPPLRKVGETTAYPTYRMSFTVQPEVSGSHLRVSIDYAFPCRALNKSGRRLAAALGSEGKDMTSLQSRTPTLASRPRKSRVGEAPLEGEFAASAESRP